MKKIYFFAAFAAVVAMNATAQVKENDSFTDEQGILKPFIEQKVEIRAENAILLGFGSALTKTDEVFDKPYHDTYRGRALAVFRAGSEGTIEIKGKSKGYPDAAAAVEVQS